MSTTLKQNTAGTRPHDAVDDSLVKKVWQDLDGEVSHEQVRRVVDEIALKYEDAPVQTFVPILIHRRALEQLRSLYKNENHPAAGQEAEDGAQRRDNKPAAAPIIIKHKKRKTTMKKITHLLHLAILIIILAACSGTAVETASVASAAAGSVISTEADTAVSVQQTTVETAAVPVSVTYDSEDLETSAITADVTTIDLAGDAISVSGEGAVVNGGSVNITSAGTYSISGVLTNGQIVVETADRDPVILILNGVDITNEQAPPFM